MNTHSDSLDRSAGMTDRVKLELERLREENTDLRACALLWRKLYEHAIHRTGEAVLVSPAPSQHYATSLLAEAVASPRRRRPAGDVLSVG